MGLHVVCFAKWVFSGLFGCGGWLVRMRWVAHSPALNLASRITADNCFKHAFVRRKCRKYVTSRQAMQEKKCCSSCPCLHPRVIRSASPRRLVAPSVGLLISISNATPRLHCLSNGGTMRNCRFFQHFSRSNFPWKIYQPGQLLSNLTKSHHDE
jgi:hypothetical protein